MNVPDASYRLWQDRSQTVSYAGLVEDGAVARDQIDDRRNRLGQLTKTRVALAHARFTDLQGGDGVRLGSRRRGGLPGRGGLRAGGAQAADQDRDRDRECDNEPAEHPDEWELTVGGHSEPGDGTARRPSSRSLIAGIRQTKHADTTAGGGKRARRVAAL